MENYDKKGHINVGTGEDYTIMDYAKKIKKIVGFKGEITNDLQMPDGVFRKKLDVTKLNKMGWRPKTSINDGLSIVYEWFIKIYPSIVKN